MPQPTPPPARPSRRALLAAAVSAPLLACTGPERPERADRTAASPDGTPPARPRGTSAREGDAAVRERVLTGEHALLARYEATAARHPSLAPRLGPLAREHAAHLAALAEDSPPAGPGESPAPSPRSPGSPGSSGGPVPATAARALAALAEAERDAARARLEDVVTASPALARLLAGIGAAEAAHAALLSARTGGTDDR